MSAMIDAPKGAHLGFGRCGVCDEAAAIVVRDMTSGIQAGACCANELKWAHRFVCALLSQCGLEHPINPNPLK